METAPKTPRWHFRFQNYVQAHDLLEEAVIQYRNGELSQLAMEGLVQRFEYTWELAWKILKDYLEYQGIAIDTISPRQVIKQAFAANLIDQPEVMFQMIDVRNGLSHRYDRTDFLTALENIDSHFLAALTKIKLDFNTRLNEDLA